MAGNDPPTTAPPPLPRPPLTTLGQPLSAISTVSTGASPRGASKPQQGGRSPSFLQLSRRASSQDRINDILETGRTRAESLSSSHPSHQTSPRLQPLLGASPGGVPNIPEQDSSADEATTPTAAAVGGAGPAGNGRSPGQSMNYQSTAQTMSVPRSRRPGANPKPSSQESGARAEQTTGSEVGGGGAGGADRNRRRSSSRANADTDEKGWLKGLLSNFRSIELENKGSVARDHLALERTFLAWLRTSLAFASIGIAVTQLFRLNASLQGSAPSSGNDTLKRLGKPLGGTFLAISILILFMGYNRYIQSQRWILKGKFPASRGSVLVISLVAFGLMALSLVVVIVVQPTSSSQAGS